MFLRHWNLDYFSFLTHFSVSSVIISLFVYSIFIQFCFSLALHFSFFYSFQAPSLINMMNSYYPQPYAQPTQQMTAVPYILSNFCFSSFFSRSDVPPQPEIYPDTTQNSSYSYNPNTTPVVPTAGNSKPYSVSPVGIDANPLGVYNPIVEPQVPSFSSTGSSPLNNNISSVPVYQQSNLCPPPPSPKEYNILPQQQLQQQPQQYYPPNPSAPVAQEVPPMAQEVPNQYAYQPQPQIQPQVQPQQQVFDLHYIF